MARGFYALVLAALVSAAVPALGGVTPPTSTAYQVNQDSVCNRDGVKVSSLVYNYQTDEIWSYECDVNNVFGVNCATDGFDVAGATMWNFGPPGARTDVEYGPCAVTN